MTPGLGLIEGFFGPPWPEEDRLAFAPFLQKHKFDFYLYAPKADPFLRKRWKEKWAKDYCEKLNGYAKHFEKHQIKFGVGLSPFELGSDRQLLKEKLSQLSDIGMEVLGLFFDDMPVHEDLAKIQLDAIDVVRNATKARIIFCPTFYSPDPILEKVFGKRPEHYFEEIRQAPLSIDFAWTGPKVIAEDISAQHLKETTTLLGRKPFLWDNLFANDGPRNCKFLKIRAPAGRARAALEESSGWAWNPMNQAALSKIVLSASAHAMLERTAPEFAIEEAIQCECEPVLARFLSAHRKEMLEQGLDKLEEATKDAWRRELEKISHPVAREVHRWLSNGYQVGAECLTD